MKPSASERAPVGARDRLRAARGPLHHAIATKNGAE